MSVYTRVSQSELEEFLREYDVGTLTHYEGISAGIENTNYFVTTTHNGEVRRFVLTLFERLNYAELPYFLQLMAHLAAAGIPTAAPIQLRNSTFLTQLNGKPAALVARLTGKAVEQPNAFQCAQVGALLAQLHLAGGSFTGLRANCTGASWRQECASAVRAKLSPDEQLLLDTVLAQGASLSAQVAKGVLPQGIIHADLFRDNALFTGETLTGVIDFYYACNDALLYDVAVTVNDWCRNADGTHEVAKRDALLAAYQAVRTFTPAEQAAWPEMLRMAALRFWLSRLYDWHFPRAGELTYRKDPNEFKQLLSYLS